MMQQEQQELVQNGNCNSNTCESSMDWEDPCSGTSSNVYPLYYVQSPSVSMSFYSPFLKPTKSNYTASVVSSQGKKGYSGYLIREALEYDDYDNDNDDYGRRQQQQQQQQEGGFCNALVHIFYRRSTSATCVFTHLLLCFLLSLALFTILFSLATRPSPPHVLVKDIELQWLRLVEGSDKSGVPTKVLYSRMEVTLEVDNDSQFFGINVESPHMRLYYAKSRLMLAAADGPAAYVPTRSALIMRTSLATRYKAVYGAGPAMEQMLLTAASQSHVQGHGLPLVLRLSLRCRMSVVWRLVRPSFRHRVVCSIFVDGSRGPEHVQISNSTCSYSTPP